MTIAALPTNLNGLSSTIMRVTPQMARNWLTLNTSNRHLNKDAVQRFSSDMRSGRWLYNGESIKFDREGRLIDGQHRLTAIVNSDAVVEMLVVTGLEPLAQQTIDVGRPRTTGQILHMHGIASANQHSALATALLRMERYPGVVWTSSAMPSKAEIVDYGICHADVIAQGVNEGAVGRRHANMPSVAYGVLFVQVQRSSQAASWEDWNERVLSGSNLDDGDPRLTLRNQMLRRVKDSRIWHQQQMIGWCLVAWNAWVEGRQLKIIRFSRDQLPMPTIK